RRLGGGHLRRSGQPSGQARCFGGRQRGAPRRGGRSRAGGSHPAEQGRAVRGAGARVDPEGKGGTGQPTRSVAGARRSARAGSGEPPCRVRQLPAGDRREARHGEYVTTAGHRGHRPRRDRLLYVAGRGGIPPADAVYSPMPREGERLHSMQGIYLDHAATTPVRPEVVAAIQECFTVHFGNPSSPHAVGFAAEAAVRRAREQVAAAAGVSRVEVVFNYGGTVASSEEYSS